MLVLHRSHWVVAVSAPVLAICAVVAVMNHETG
jgi:hypothetical protein